MRKTRYRASVWVLNPASGDSEKGGSPLFFLGKLMTPTRFAENSHISRRLGLRYATGTAHNRC